MARSKKSKSGGKSKGGLRQPPKGAAPLHNRQSSQSSKERRSSFSLREIGRNAQQSGLQVTQQRLWDQGVGFTRSDEAVEPEFAQENIDAFRRMITSPDALDSLTPAYQSSQLADLNHGMMRVERASSRVSAQEMQERLPSPTPSNSSAEEVVFMGRQSVRHPVDNTPSSPKKPLTSKEMSESSSRQELRKGQLSPLWQSTSPRHVKTTVPGHAKPIHGGMWGNAKEKLGVRSSSVITSDPSNDHGSRDEATDDYIANILQQHNSASSKPATRRDDRMLDGWETSNIGDFDDISTSDEVMSGIERILSRRQRSSGIQYLVVGEGQTVDEARWILHSALDAPGAAEMIESYNQAARESDLAKSLVHSDADSDQDNPWRDVDDDDESSDEDEDFEDERDLIEKKMERMTDENIARLWAKQEELGLGSDELLLFDADGEEGVDWGDEYDLGSRSKKTKSRQKRRSTGLRNNFQDPALTPLDGDDYGNYDIMDRRRVDLSDDMDEDDDDDEEDEDEEKWVTRDNGGFGVTDPDLARTLTTQWASDRKKKKAKKIEREELRAQGLLGKKNKSKVNLSQKYQEGMTLDDIKDSLEEFLFSGDQSFALPPMDKRERKIVHEIASAFNLKSKSAGGGRSRFPVLYRTARTRDFDDAAFSKLQNRLARRYFPRMDQKPKARSVKGSRGAARNEYADGEKVGAAAPELGSDNRGRAMLEKMGWSHGKALGATGNEGILQPIEHVMKKSRTGLG